MTAKSLTEQLQQLVSESQNPNTVDIDTLDSAAIVELLHTEDDAIQQAIAKALSEIATAVDWIVSALSDGGRLIYLGAGTSGRLGVLDAVECIPTFGLPEGRIIGVIAGGEAAMFRAQEGIEDQPQQGMDDLKALDLNHKDIVVGIAASGRTPYVAGGLEYAQSVSARTIALTSNPDASINQWANLPIVTVVGPETPAGSSRMKSGTAQKQVLNMLSTASMIRLGKCYQNLMIDLKPGNAKLVARSLNMIMQITGVDEATAQQALTAADNEVKCAVFMVLADCSAEDAHSALITHQGFLRKALLARDD